MTRLSTLAFAILFFAPTADAQTAVVRSGEHETFTRLTISMPRDSNWSINSNEQVVEVRSSLPGIRFDTSQAFSRIPRTRLIDIKQKEDEGALLLSLGCDCSVVGFRETDRLFVIDIRDRERKIENSYAGIDLKMIIPDQYNFSSQLSSQITDENMTLKLPTTVNSNSSIDPQLPPDPVEPASLSDSTEGALINISEQRLLEQIGRASQQGLLQPTTLLGGSKNQLSQDQQEADRNTSTRRINITVETSIDREMKEISGSLHTIPLEQECLPDSLVSVSDWADGRTFSDQIGLLRSEVFEEFDLIDQAVTKKMAKSYLHFGFGAEAKDALSLLENHGAENSILVAMASLMDDASTFSPNPFDGQENCDGDVALWAVLSRSDNASHANSTAIQQAFARLPPHLRSHLGPRLSRAFSNTGNTSIASAILRAIDRTDSYASPERDFAFAVLKNTAGNYEEANEKLAEVVERNTQVAPEALIELIETHWRERLPIDPNLPELAAAYATELRSTERASSMQRALAISLALSGDFDSAFSTLIDMKRQGRDFDHKTVAIPLLTLLEENADDVTFLKYIIDHDGEHDSIFPGDLENSIARRLLDLGFPDIATNYLSGNEFYSTSSARQLMRAESSIALGLPHRALVDLLGVPGPEADQLRAEAMWKNGEYKMASEILQKYAAEEGASRGFWFTDTFDEFRESDDSKYAKLAEVSRKLQQELSNPDELPPLASARALLEDSQSVRANISKMLGFVGQTHSEN
jgi:hypothetical protein